MADTLHLELPAKSDYLLPLRLFISGIATRMEYSVSDIEDIRACVSEACALLLRCVLDGRLKLEIIADEGLLVRIVIEAGIWQGEREDDELPRVILEAMTEEFFLKETDGWITEINMSFSK